MKQRPLTSDEPLVLPEPETDTQLTREFLFQALGLKKGSVDRLLGLEPEEG
jgi:hypothetical protein